MHFGPLVVDMFDPKALVSVINNAIPPGGELWTPLLYEFLRITARPWCNVINHTRACFDVDNVCQCTDVCCIRYDHLVFYIDGITKPIALFPDDPLLRLQNNEERMILQFHYISWPDFGVPSDSETFLSFLYTVRQSGVIPSEPGEVGPPVIHCSAGIGRSGTFCLVDSALVLVSIPYSKLLRF